MLEVEFPDSEELVHDVIGDLDPPLLVVRDDGGYGLDGYLLQFTGQHFARFVLLLYLKRQKNLFRILRHYY